MPNTEVPADTFPVRTATLFVAAIPVPASPSGGQTGMPALQLAGYVKLLCALCSQCACALACYQYLREDL